MSGKRGAVDGVGGERRKKRSSIALDVKMEVIKRSREGERAVDIGRRLNLPPTSVRTIVKNADEIESKAKHVLKHSEVKITRQRSVVMEQMEQLLALWIEDLHSKNAPISLALVQEKALSLYEDLKRELGEAEAAKEKPFKAARGWFYRFQARYSFKDVNIQGESANADADAAEMFPERLKIVEGGGYDPTQVLNHLQTPSPIKRNSSTPRGAVTKQEDEGSLGTERLRIVVKTEVEQDAPDLNRLKVEECSGWPEETGNSLECLVTADQNFIEVELSEEDFGGVGAAAGELQRSCPASSLKSSPCTNHAKRSGKRPASDIAASSSKKPRNTISFEVKLDVLNRFDAGERAVDISSDLGLPPTSVRTIRANAHKIREYARSVTTLNAARIIRGRDKVKDNMERLLSVWIEDQGQRNVPMSLMMIQEKAKSLFRDLKKEHGEISTMPNFSASRGWFDRFKRRCNLHNLKMTSEAAVVDLGAAKRYLEQFKFIVEEGGYSPQQIFNVDKTDLHWKRMPSRARIPEGEKAAAGFEAAKDRLTLLLGGNASGDVKLKPLLVYHSEHPRALAGYCKNNLPVIWRANKEARVTTAVFQDWFTSCFCPFVRDHCARNKLEHKALLVLDTAPEHPANLDDLAENVRVVFLPPNATSPLLPVGRVVTATFKAYYLRRLMGQLAAETDGVGKPTVGEFWRGYDIRKAVDNVGAAWREVTPAHLNGAWRQIWPECVDGSTGFAKTVPEIRREIVGLARRAGFDGVDEGDVRELLEWRSEEPSHEDLLQLKRRRRRAEEEEEDESLHAVTPPPKQLTAKRLSEAFGLFEAGMDILTEDDPNMERSCALKWGFESLVRCYKELYQQKKKKEAATAVQMSLQSFFGEGRSGKDS
ncbi:tigger transposable element-derived protein 1-like [Lethenteron reissneri]|uniref:tigger transposable element-derived protein 1-like n=1 Tax=Lethenteron reissneri TaxID=7753 RepID=UPI002AB68741|nr:tigger transposable element-derived protein 1-like [Lethenteron reissneri]